MIIDDTAKALMIAQMELSRMLFEDVDEMGRTFSLEEIARRSHSINNISNSLCDHIQLKLRMTND